MSDYIPDPRSKPDKYGRFEGPDYVDPTYSRSNFALVGLLAIAALIGGLMYFGGPTPSNQQAQTPPTTMTTPANPDAVPAAPLAPARPAPATPRTPQ